MRVALAAATTVSYMTEVDIKGPQFGNGSSRFSFLRYFKFNHAEGPLSHPKLGVSGVRTVFNVTPVVFRRGVTPQRGDKSVDDKNDVELALTGGQSAKSIGKKGHEKAYDSQVDSYFVAGPALALADSNESVELEPPHSRGGIPIQITKESVTVSERIEDEKA